ncbi:MAG TPA: NAD(P)/FAD-dependent oxidoreductase [Burkholderiales bacterium]|nr:NAD(P)/FAD-dependent oxidoreductase [Burkholderiales bacterium]
MADEALYDCAIIGGGPAGLLAAVYLARFRRKPLLVDAGRSRARWIPRTRNIPAYADGLEGDELLARLREQVARYSIETVADEVMALEGKSGEFLIRGAHAVWRARHVILATGVVDRMPEHLENLWTLVKRGAVRLCPVCDAFELCERRIGLLAEGDVAEREARFLASYSATVSVFAPGEVVEVVHGTAGLSVRTRSGTLAHLDALYVGCGSDVHSGLATALGARCDEQGFLFVDQKQQTSVPGLYAAGDVVQSLSQISVAYGQAAIAASAINVALNA